MATLNGDRRSRPRAKLAASADDFAVHTLSLIGLEGGKRFFQTLTGNIIASPTGQLAVGFGAGTEVSPLRLARAYTIFGNNGALTDANPISQIFLDGKEVDYEHKPARRVVDAGAAYVTVQMLRSVLGYGPDGLGGTARQAFAKTGLSAGEVEMAGKTGSGPNSVWMVSVSPKLVIVVWLGYQCRSEIKNAREMFSRDTAALVWAEFVKSVHKYRPDLLAGKFQRPEKVTEFWVDPLRGCRTERRGSIAEFFTDGAEPGPCERALP